MVETRIHYNTGVDLSGSGLPPILPPFPDFGGKLYAGYMFGTEYGQFARDRNAINLGARYDWSGNGRHLATLGDAVIGDWSFPSVISTAAQVTTTFTQDQLENNEGLSIYFFCNSASNAKALSVKSTNSSPLVQMALEPVYNSGDGRIRAISDNSGTAAAAITPINDGVVGANSLYGASYNAAGTSRSVFAKRPGGAIKTGTEGTSKALNGANPFWIALETSTGAGVNTFYGCAFVRGPLVAADFELGQQYFHNFHQGVESGISFYTA
jgi:hypothetical protein